MLKPTKAKAAVFLVLVAVMSGPLFLVDNGPALIVPIVAIFWLDGLAQALGVAASVDGGVDAFNLVPPNALGTALILLGSAVSLAAVYVTAAWLVWVCSKYQPRPESARP